MTVVSLLPTDSLAIALPGRNISGQRGVGTLDL